MGHQTTTGFEHTHGYDSRAGSLVALHGRGRLAMYAVQGLALPVLLMTKMMTAALLLAPAILVTMTITTR